MYYPETDNDKAERVGDKINTFIDSQMEKEVINGYCLEMITVRVLWHLIRIYIRGWGDDPRKQIYKKINHKYKTIERWKTKKEK